jgi:hypothetical protein
MTIAVGRDAQPSSRAARAEPAGKGPMMGVEPEQPGLAFVAAPGVSMRPSPSPARRGRHAIDASPHTRRSATGPR